jgi:hypothetical protein
MRKILSAVLLAALFAAPCLGAEEKGEVSDAARAVANATLAERLAELGRAQRSPMLLASAAQLLREAGTFEEREAETTEEPRAGGGAGSGGKAGDKKPAGVKNTQNTQNTPASLYAEAIAAAKEKGDGALAAVLENQSRVGGTRGLVFGACAYRGEVSGRVTYNLNFRGKYVAMVSAVGDGDDLDMFVYDEGENLVGYDDGDSSVASVSWTPESTGYFKVVLENAADAPYIVYEMRAN